MKAIGGYFELTLNDTGTLFHNDALAFNSCRNALEYLLKIKKIRKVYLPHYNCEVMLEPLSKTGTSYEFYSIDKSLEPLLDKQIPEDEYFLYVNYFGLKNHFLPSLVKKFPHLIIDNSQAFFSMPLKGTDTIYSPRKFFGLPDGGFLYTNYNRDEYNHLPVDISLSRFSHLIKRIELGPEEGFKDFQNNDDSLINQPTCKMSNLTKTLLRSVDFKSALKIRNENFMRLHSLLESSNRLTHLINCETIHGPLIYPYLADKLFLKTFLIQNKIYVATYWPSIKKFLSENQIIENELIDRLISLPIDHRQNQDDMNYIAEIITSFNGK